MGSDSHYPEEAPVHRVTVAGFWIDATRVTNGAFRKCVQATGYITCAEIRPDPSDYPGALPHMLSAGSLVFTPPRHQVDLRDWSQWWRFNFGANWRRPYGPRSSISGSMITPSFTSLTVVRKRMPPGWAKNCRWKRSGHLPLAVVSTGLSSPGAINLPRSGDIWPIPGRGNSHSRISPTTALNAHRQ